MADNQNQSALQSAGQGAAAGSAFGPWGAAIGGAAGLLGGLASQGQRNAATGIQQDIYNQYANLQTPSIDQEKLALAMEQSAGNLSPEKLQAAQLGSKDAYQNIANDPRLVQAQYNNLQLLSKIANSGGLTPQDQAQLNSIRRQTEADTNAAVQQQLQNQQARGVGTSDAALAARLLQAQQGANRQSQQADDTASMAFQRALQAASNAGTLGSQMENQQYQQQANLANALNSREYTNTNLQNQANAQNVNAFNQAQQYNLSNAQNIANNNTNLQNQQQQYNKGLYQQQYQDQLAKLSGMQGQGANLSNTYNSNANRIANQYTTVGEGIGKVGQAFANQSNNNSNNSSSSL